MTKDKAYKILEQLKKQHPDAGCELTFGSVFQLLVAVILSAQCTDKRVNAVTEKLFKKYATPYDFAKLSEEELGKEIFSCGFYKNKSKSIISMSKDVIERFDGKVPDTMEDLTSLAGVGRKTASVVLSVAYKVPAMPVDTHVFRLSRRIGLSDGDTVELVEKDLRKTYAPEDWYDAHHTLIFHGRYICHSRKPNCEECSLKELCREYKE